MLGSPSYECPLILLTVIFMASKLDNIFQQYVDQLSFQAWQIPKILLLLPYVQSQTEYIAEEFLYYAIQPHLPLWRNILPSGFLSYWLLNHWTYYRNKETDRWCFCRRISKCCCKSLSNSPKTFNSVNKFPGFLEESLISSTSPLKAIFCLPQHKMSFAVILWNVWIFLAPFPFFIIYHKRNWVCLAVHVW